MPWGITNWSKWDEDTMFQKPSTTAIFLPVCNRTPIGGGLIKSNCVCQARLCWVIEQIAQSQLIPKHCCFFTPLPQGEPYVIICRLPSGGGLIKSNCVVGQQCCCVLRNCCLFTFRPYGSSVCCCLTPYVTSSKSLWCHISQMFLRHRWNLRHRQHDYHKNH